MNQEYGKLMIGIGILLVVLGLLVAFGPRIPWLGRLPGDISVKKENFSFYFPLATCLLVSAVFSLIMFFFRR